MSYSGISIREALEKINKHNGGWFLPEVQRQYVWGVRDESEDHVCLLLDSLLRKYPIGGIVLWETRTEVPFREFLGDFMPNGFAKLVDKGLWGMEKSLVYDGQQRLQTLRSVLKHRFKGRVLHYDLQFDAAASEPDETGFELRDPDEPENPRYLRMTWLMSVNDDQRERVLLERRVVAALGDLTESEELLVKSNIAALWQVFVETNQKSIAFFSVRADTAKEVNEVFRRLNTGGVALTQIELVLSKMKAAEPSYEEKLWKISEQIQASTGGYDFSSQDVLQYLHLLVKGTIRIEADRVTDDDVLKLRAAVDADSPALLEMFRDYLHGHFRINNLAVVPRPLALLPIAAYYAAARREKHETRMVALPQASVQKLDQFFLLSQFCDWATQTMVNAFSKSAMTAGKGGAPFPLDAAKATAKRASRVDVLREDQFLSRPLFAAKVLTPDRAFVFHERKPQVDHIFPVKLAEGDEAYRRDVDVLWNMQPTPADVNNFKRAKHPRTFFQSEEGGRFFGQYDYIPEPTSHLWDDYKAFLRDREARMRAALESRYGLVLESAPA